LNILTSIKSGSALSIPVLSAGVLNWKVVGETVALQDIPPGLRVIKFVGFISESQTELDDPLDKIARLPALAVSVKILFSATAVELFRLE
jgi:hypothetical protein